MEYCNHELDPRTMFCVKCGLSAEAIAGGRDRPPTWEDVDEAYNDAYRLGIEIGMAQYKYTRRKKLIEVGYYLCLRRLSQSTDKGGEIR